MHPDVPSRPDFPGLIKGSQPLTANTTNPAARTANFLFNMSPNYLKNTVQQFATVLIILSAVCASLGSGTVQAQKFVLTETIPIHSEVLEKGHKWDGIQIGLLDSTQGVLALNTRYPKGRGDQNIASTRYYAPFSLTKKTVDTASQINPILLRFMGKDVYPAGFMAMDSVSHFFYSQFVPGKKIFRLFAYSVQPTDSTPKSSFRVLFEISTSDPDQVAFRFSQTGKNFGLAFMQLEDDRNERAILTWRVYTQTMKTVYERTEKINFGGGSVSLMEYALTPELVGLTTLQHGNSKSKPNGIAYYVVSRERTSVYQGELIITRNQAPLGTWIRYNTDSAQFDVGGILAPSAYRIAERCFHFSIPLQRVDLPRGGTFPLPEEWVQDWKADQTEYGFRYFGTNLVSLYRVQPAKGMPWSMTYAAGGAHKGKPFQSDFLVAGTQPNGIRFTTRLERNFSVNRENSAVGLFTVPEVGAFLLAHAPVEPTPPGAKNVNAAEGPVLTQILPDGSTVSRPFPKPSDASGNYFYEGAEMVNQKQLLLPYQTAAGLSLALYSIEP